LSDQPSPETPDGVPEESPNITSSTSVPEAPRPTPEGAQSPDPVASGSGIPPKRELISVVPLPADSDAPSDVPTAASKEESPQPSIRIKSPKPLVDTEHLPEERPDLPERRTKAIPQERPLQRSEAVQKSQPAPKAPPPEKSQPAKKSKPAQPADHYTLVTVVSALRALSLTFAAAVIVSTIFMIFTSPDFLSAGTRKELGQVRATAQSIAAAPTPLPTPVWFKRVGVVAGHSGIATYGTTRGNVDTGAVCDDGFTEASVTMKVAQQVVAALQGRGYTVDLLQEFDLRLDNYQAAAFISLHADSCEKFDDGFNHSGFKLAYPVDRLTVRDQDLRLSDCIRDNYGPVTGLPFTPGGITDAMTRYHAFHLSLGHPGIASTTPGLILELGLLSYDRDLLQNHSDKSAKGIVNGLLCYLDPRGQPAVPPVAPATIAPETPAAAPQ